jgi:O-antigen/teichoic acid export membrane protein
MKTLFAKLNTELVRNFLIYSLGALFLKGVSFFLIPLYTRLLTPTEYGYLDLLNTFAGILEVVLSLGLAQVFFMEFYQISREKRLELLNRILSAYLILSSILYVITFSVIIVLYETVFPGIRLVVIATVMLTTYLTFFQGLMILILKLSSRAFELTIFQIVVGLLGISLNILFVYFLRSGYEGVIWAGVISILCSSVFGLSLYIKRGGRFALTFELNQVKELLRYGLPFIPNTLSFWMMNSANRWILFHYAGGDQVGYFSLAMKFGSLFDPLVIQPFLSAYAPRVLKKFGEGDFRQPLAWLFAGSLVFFIIVGFIMQQVAGFIIDANFYPALALIPIAILGFGFNFMSQSAALLLVFRKKVNILLLCILIGASVSVIANFILTPLYGGIGSALGTMVGNFSWLLIIVYFVYAEKRKMNSNTANLS